MLRHKQIGDLFAGGGGASCTIEQATGLYAVQQIDCSFTVFNGLRLAICPLKAYHAHMAAPPRLQKSD